MAQFIGRPVGEQVKAFLEEFLGGYDNKYGLGSMSCAIYDTAIVSLVYKQSGVKPGWVFPSCFEYLLKTQEESGGWQSGASEIDGILNTLAGLLAISKHSKDSTAPPDIAYRLEKATQYLNNSLEKWNVGATVHVAFEILVPMLLEVLAKTEDIHFDFPGKSPLFKIRDKKLSKFDPSFLYSKHSSSILHSLEGLVGRVDYDRVAPLKIFGSMMASPSATAAYIMHASTWDEEAEDYLRHVVSAGAGKGSGGVPSAFPSTIFEITWVVTTLMEHGVTAEAFSDERLSMVTRILQESYKAGGGITGFAPQLTADADDSAMCITALNLLGVPVSAAKLVEEFETTDHFKTYDMERNPSFSANCNVLIALLSSTEGPCHYAVQTEKVIKFICNTWWTTNGEIDDKWNLSPMYSTMLMSKALSRVLLLWCAGAHKEIPGALVGQHVLLTMFQALLLTLRSQNADGSWGTCREETAYGILALNALTVLPLARPFRAKIDVALSGGRTFLEQHARLCLEPDRLWIEKVTYGSQSLTKAYTLAAMTCVPWKHDLSVEDLRLGLPSLEKILQSSKFYRKLPMFSQTPEWSIQASVIESSLFLGKLEAGIPRVFPREGMREEKYLAFIPFTWVGGNELQNRVLSNQILLDMMTISALIYQVDEFMEGVVGSLSRDDMGHVKSVIETVFEETNSNHTAKNGTIKSGTGDFANDPSPIASIKPTLSHFTEFVLRHPGVLSASSYDKQQLQINLKDFLLSHMTQVEDNHAIQYKNGTVKIKSSAPRRSFFDWVRSISANHTGGPFAFSYILCLLGNQTDALETAEEKFIGEDISRHISTACRMINDWGSVDRDRLEYNLNSVDFYEFSHEGQHGDVMKAKIELFQIAKYEQKCLDLALSELEKKSKSHMFNSIKAFCDVTNMYGELYVLKDLTPRVRKRAYEETV
ncbi:MAG: hypothetical protein MMC33_001239 [Icmadophila ericetorum]|nr:hypothetical protein [Icmadophila ericetorum]